MARYLRRIEETWSLIVGGNEKYRLLIDPNTVYLFQDCCPGLSSEDRAFVQMRMLSGELVPAIRADLSDLSEDHLFIRMWLSEVSKYTA
jgi:hypothetical protein